MVVLDDADGQAEELVDAAHPLGVAAGQVVVDGDDVDAAAGEGVEVDGERGHERLPFARLHLGDLAAVQDDAAHELDVEVAHVEHALARLAADREGLGEEVVERVLEVFFRRFERLLFVARDLPSSPRRRASTAGLSRSRNSAVFARRPSSVSALISGSRALISRDDGQHALHVALVLRAENGGKYFIDHGAFSVPATNKPRTRGEAQQLVARGARSGGAGERRFDAGGGLVDDAWGRRFQNARDAGCCAARRSPARW